MKDTFYFSHDYNARSDDKTKRLIRKHGILGYGIYWAIVEDLYNNANALQTDYEGIAFDLRVDAEIIESIINDFDLFIVDGEEFGSMSVQNRIDARNKKSKKARENANKRWAKNANAMRPQCDRNAIKERKGKEINNITIKSVSSPPEGVDALYFYIAKAYHKMFYDYKESKSLENAELYKWINTIRLLVEIDKVTITQLIAVKQFLQAGINKDRGVDTFWSDTIFSINALRKKSIDGVYQFDRIKQDAKKWLDKNPEQEALVYQAEVKLMERANG